MIMNTRSNLETGPVHFTGVFSYHVRFAKCFRARGMRITALKGIPGIHSVLLVTVERQKLISGPMMWNTCIHSTAKDDDNII